MRLHCPQVSVRALRSVRMAAARIHMSGLQRRRSVAASPGLRRLSRHLLACSAFHVALMIGAP